SGNVICLDILRAMNKEPDALSSVLDEISQARGADARFDGFLNHLETDLLIPPDEVAARRIAERMVLALQASLLIRHSIPAVSDAFCAARLANDSGRAFRPLPATAYHAKTLATSLIVIT